MKTHEIVWMMILIAMMAFVFGTMIAPKAHAVNEETVSDIVSAAHEAAELYDVPAELILAMIDVESGFNPDAKNGKCIGLMQINTINLDWLNSEFERELDLYDINDNVRAGSYILAGYYHKYGINYALMAYSGGGNYARKLWDKGVRETRYVRSVLKSMTDFACL